MLLWVSFPPGVEILPDLDLDEERNTIHAVTEIIRGGHALACHDISEGGLLGAVAEMVMGGWGMGKIGAELDLEPEPGLTPVEMLFGESGGFIIEVVSSEAKEVTEACSRYGAGVRVIGRTVAGSVLDLAVGGERVPRRDCLPAGRTPRMGSRGTPLRRGDHAQGTDPVVPASHARS